MDNRKKSEHGFYGAEKTAEICQLWPRSAQEQMNKIVEQCVESDRIFGNIQSTDQNIAVKAGFIAEEWHTETFNLDAILKGKIAKAFTDKSHETPLSLNDPKVDILVTDQGKQILSAQCKYYKTSDKTANELRQLDNNREIKYTTDIHIVPEDQKTGVKNSLNRTAIKNSVTRPEVANAAEKAKKKVTDIISYDDIESAPLKKADAEKMAGKSGDADKMHKTVQNRYKKASTIQQMGKAAKGAAITTSVIAGTLNSIHYLSLVRTGEMTEREAAVAILKSTTVAVGDSVLKATVATGAVSSVVRFFPELFKGAMFKTSLITGAVSGTAICAVDLIQCLVKIAAGRMTMTEMEERTGKNIFQTGSGVLGASIGGALGTPAGPVGIFIGSMIGGMITSVSMTVAIKNHIDEPYRKITENTSSLVDAEKLLENAVSNLTVAQNAFDNFTIGCSISEREFEGHMQEIRQASEKMWDKIDKI